MSEFFRTAIYTKNIPGAERALRLAGALGVGVAAALFVTDPWTRWALAGTAVTLVLTGLVGFCPACYLAGRKLPKRAST